MPSYYTTFINQLKSCCPCLFDSGANTAAELEARQEQNKQDENKTRFQNLEIQLNSIAESEASLDDRKTTILNQLENYLGNGTNLNTDILYTLASRISMNRSVETYITKTWSETLMQQKNAIRKTAVEANGGDSAALTTKSRDKLITMIKEASVRVLANQLLSLRTAINEKRDDEIITDLNSICADTATKLTTLVGWSNLAPEQNTRLQQSIGRYHNLCATHNLQDKCSIARV